MSKAYIILYGQRMKEVITTEDIVTTLLSEKFLTTLRRASMITNRYNVETMLRPYLRSPTWEPDVYNFIVGNKRTVGGGNAERSQLQEKVGEYSDSFGGLPLLTVHFHPKARVLVPSSVRRRGDLCSLLNSRRGHWLISSDATSEEVYIDFRRAMGIARVDEKYDINILLLQLKSLPGTWRELRRSYAGLRSINDSLSVAYLLGPNVEQELVVEILSSELNTALFSIPYQETNSLIKRQEFRERNHEMLENKLKEFASEIVITERVHGSREELLEA